MAAAVKVGELSALIERFAGVLQSNSADNAAVVALQRLSALLSGHEAKTVAAFLKLLTHTPSSTPAEAHPPVATVVPALESLRTLLDGIAKKSLNESLDSLLDVVRFNANVPISELVVRTSEDAASKGARKTKPKGKRAAAPMDQHLIDDYVQRLEGALGDDSRFGALLEELRADQRISDAGAGEIASRLYGGKRSRTLPREKALKRVLERHENLMKFKRQPSTAGRPAA